MSGIWQKLPKPFFVLAPMDDVTDSVFRQIIASIAKPDLFFTEFTNCDGLTSQGKDKLMHRLQFTPSEKPIIAQIWGIHPQTFKDTARLCAQLGFDGIDINMGCPVRKVTTIGACSGLINNPTLAAEIIAATKEGAQNVPVSVKTRIGFNTIQTDKWISFLLKQKLAALTVHGRTAKEESKIPAHWSEIKKAVELRNAISPFTILIGNGDVTSKQDGLEKASTSGVDGIMVGRGIFSNPWLFDDFQNIQNKNPEEKLSLLLKHARLFDQTWKDQKRIKKFDILKKFFKIYTSGFEGAVELRTELMKLSSLDEVEQTINSFLN